MPLEEIAGRLVLNSILKSVGGAFLMDLYLTKFFSICHSLVFVYIDVNTSILWRLMFIQPNLRMQPWKR